MVINEEENDYLYCTTCQKTVPYEHAFEIDTSGDNNTDGNLECPTCHEKRVGHPEFILCAKCQDSVDMQDIVYDNNSGFGYCKVCSSRLIRDEFVVNKYITLKLRGNKTIIYIDGEEISQCMYLLMNIPKTEAQDEECVNIDEFKDKYSSELEVYTNGKANKFGIPPETEFWGHCSNIQAWVENGYNPNVLHSNLAVPLLKLLCFRDVRVFHSLLYHLDEMWKAYKTPARKVFIISLYKELIGECIVYYELGVEDLSNSIFIRALYHLDICNRMDEFIRNVYKHIKNREKHIQEAIFGLIKNEFYWDKEVDRNGMGVYEWETFKRKRSYWERKIYGTDLLYRRWLRHLRNHDVSVKSHVEGYLPYLWAKEGQYWYKLKDESRHGNITILNAYLSEGIEYTKHLDWTYNFCNGWNGSHNLNRYAVRYKDGTIAIRHLVL